MYRGPRDPFVLLVDRSIQMLRRGVQRLAPGNGPPLEAVSVLHADIAAMPVRAGVFSSVLCLNVLHVPCDASAIAAEFARVLVPGSGRLFVSSLVRSGRWSDAYMTFLNHIGELAAPLTLDQLSATVAGEWGVVESAAVEGNMAFLEVRHAG
jgi:ubiquinone/menaquinone biosynthesis C-methylase UbiE